MNRSRLASFVLIVLALTVNATLMKATPRMPAPMDEADCVGVTSNNTIISFSSKAPGQVLSEIPLIGLLSGEGIKTIESFEGDILLAYSNRGRLYKINVINGIAAPVGFDPPFSQGEVVSMVFDAAANLIRVITNTGRHLAVDPQTGNVVRNLGSLMYQAEDPNAAKTPQIQAAALPFTDSTLTDNSIFSAFGYLIDLSTNSLVRLGRGGSNPEIADAGKIRTVAPLGVDIFSVIGFDICRITNAALAVIVPKGQTSPRLYRINLVTGAVTDLGEFAAGSTIASFTTTNSIDDAFAFFDPQAASGIAGQEKTVAAKVFFNGKPVDGVNVMFQVFEGPNAGTTGEAVTGDGGVAAFKYTSSGQVGTDFVVMSGVASSIVISSVGKVVWDRSPFTISAVTRDAKNLVVTGCCFQAGDTVFINDIQQKTKTNPGNFTTVLIAKKGFKKLEACDADFKNRVFVRRNEPGKPVVDTEAFATCP